MERSLTSWLLRTGVGFAFIYPPINALMQPDAWIGYFPGFVQSFAQSAGIPLEVVLHSFGVVEVIIALWIFSGWKIFWPCLVAAAMLLGIVAFNGSEFQVLFRDVSIAIAALALASMNRPGKRAAAPTSN
jgi:uncharacterized membrane protein YphA (DoxX/SURF4 family)